jgi:hypothetical protein
MKIAQRVWWTKKDGTHGTGVTISGESDGHILVAVDAPAGEHHPVIYCATTWLTEGTAPSPEAKDATPPSSEPQPS